jgi:hypothetical protein
MEHVTSGSEPKSRNLFKLIISWTIVGVPSLWAVWQVVVKTVVLFQ